MTDVSQNLEDTRRAKGAAWAELGFAAYGNDTGELTPLAEVRAKHEASDGPALDVLKETLRYRVAGRVMLSRSAGKLRFVTLRDATATIQLFVSKAAVTEKEWAALEQVDLGDVLLAEGPPMKTKTGELSLGVRALRPLTKALIPPAKFAATEDVETRYRQRYRDLIENRDEVADVFRARSAIVTALRSFLDARDFLEVETPMLHSLRGGATARPFRTHHNALELSLYLRIAPELYLKRLVVGGFERVYELGRAFRNEGISTRHNPEFTILEYYQAYATHRELLTQTEELFAYVDARVLERFPRFAEGRSFDLTRPWPRVRMLDAARSALAKRFPEALSRWAPFGEGARGTHAELAAWLAENPDAPLSKEDRAYLRKCHSDGELLFALYELFAEKHLTEDYRTEDRSKSVPVFIVDHPVETSPLARAKDPAKQREEYGDTTLRLTDRFELFVEGREVCNAFSELNDPDDQAARFLAQLANRDRGDDEAMDYDADYLRALKHGMPPTAGFGLGVDRLAMLLTGAKSIRDVILFPLLRPEVTEGGEGAGG